MSIPVSAQYSYFNPSSAKADLNSFRLTFNSQFQKNQYGLNRIYSSSFEDYSSIERLTNKLDDSEIRMIDGTYWRTNSDINSGRFWGIMGGILAIDIAAMIYQSNVWYHEGTTDFHTLDFSDDMNKWQYMDKIGHFTNAFFTSDLSGKLYRWAGMSGENSIYYGALTGWLFLLQIEIYDGFMKGWGFSWGDLLANTFGSGFYLLQQFNYDLLGGIHPKFSYHMSEAYKENRYWQDPGVIEDYEGMTFWLAVNPHHYFSENLKKDYPQWLAPFGIALGYTVKDIASNPYGGYGEFLVGLDIDVRKIPIGDDADWFRFFKSELNFLRMPLPAVKFSPDGTIWYGLYF
ncbi:MAG TPA: DUF2279 domain-containing protein [Ignavibacteriaceae bacterium]